MPKYFIKYIDPREVIPWIDETPSTFPNNLGLALNIAPPTKPTLIPVASSQSVDAQRLLTVRWYPVGLSNAVWSADGWGSGGSLSGKDGTGFVPPRPGNAAVPSGAGSRDIPVVCATVPYQPFKVDTQVGKFNSWNKYKIAWFKIQVPEGVKIVSILVSVRYHKSVQIPCRVLIERTTYLGGLSQHHAARWQVGEVEIPPFTKAVNDVMTAEGVFAVQLPTCSEAEGWFLGIAAWVGQLDGVMSVGFAGAQLVCQV